MNTVFKKENLSSKKTYECPKIFVTFLNLEHGIAAGSVQTGFQQEHNEENLSFDIEW
ncbi:hypothetical protein [Sphingobacterium sp.]|uniref:hypothetical protein n=1 Tax=Sphingobacterium sp. TaxID=341027 RepID=UPI0031D5EEA5